MSHNGQTVLEYLLLIGIIMMALIYMGTDVKRGFQSVIKVTADQIGNQANSDQDFNSTQGYLINSWSGMIQNHQQTLHEHNGIVSTFINDVTQSGTASYTNQGTSN